MLALHYLIQVFFYTQILSLISFDLFVFGLELVSVCYDKQTSKCITFFGKK